MKISTHALTVTLVLSLSLALPTTATPPNDACGSALLVPMQTLPFVHTVDTTEATTDGDPAVPCTTIAPNKSVWYRIRPETTDYYALDTTGTVPAAYTPLLSLYVGSCGGLVPVPNACARRRLVAPMLAGNDYYLLVSGEAVSVSPGIMVAQNGVDLCPGGPGPGGGTCGTNFTVRVGDSLSVRAYNQLDATLLTIGTFDWSLGTNASPATATGPSAAFKYTAPVDSTNVVLNWTPPGQSPITKMVTMNVLSGMGGTSTGTPTGPAPLAAGETATLSSPGGMLRLTVQRNAPVWSRSYLVPSVTHQVGAAGVPFVSDLSVTNLEAVETVVGLELWTADGRHESAPFTLVPEGTKTVADVVKTAFHLDQAYGALLVSSTGEVAAGARTWAPVALGGTNGQFAPASDVTYDLSSDAVLRTGEVGILTGVRQDASFRTNVGIYNVVGSSCVVEVEARDDEGRPVGSKVVVTVPPFRYVQETLARVAGSSLPSGSVVLTNATSGCVVGSVAYVIDNATQDPFAVLQVKKP